MYLKCILCLAILSCTYGSPVGSKFRADYTYSESTVGSPAVSEFRADYTYSESTDNYYKIHVVPSEWQNAVAKCSSEGALLYYPENEREAIEVGALFNYSAYFVNPIWLGISDLSSDRVFETIDGRPIEEVHHKWNVLFNQPAKKKYGYHCVIMWDDFGLWLWNCDEHHLFICKYSPKRESNSGDLKHNHLDLTIASSMDKSPTPMSGGYLNITGRSYSLAEEEMEDEVQWNHGHANFQSMSYVIITCILLILF